MCGIVGYVGNGLAAPILVGGLRRMEYRGYDSAGIALIDKAALEIIKRQGKVSQLAAAVASDHPARVGIGHTRWATHGNPSERNAHPHQVGKIAIVHNGIIENYAELKEELKGTKFESDTDTEVLAHLVERRVAGGQNLLDAVRETLLSVEGTFGLAVVSADEPGTVVAARRGSPLLLGVDDEAMYVASDATAVIGYTDRVVYMEDDQVAVVTKDGYEIFDLAREPQKLSETTLKLELKAIEKAGYDHFLLKEIMEQPVTIADMLRGRLDLENGTSHLGGLNVLDDFLREQQRFLTVGCGTAYYAGLLGKYLLERMTGIPVDVEYGSEFRYREAALSPGTLALFVSQSGETADTLASLMELKRRGVPTLGLVNVVGSTLAREVDGGVYLHAGPEISVASTKAFTAQVVGQMLVGLQVARSRSLSLAAGQEVVKALQELPRAIEQALERADQIKQLAKTYARFNNVMFLGRDSLFPVALEGSHKLKEVSYVHAEAYPAGEMKHGANALIDEDLLIVFLAPRNNLYGKTRSNIEEVRARAGTVLAVATEGDKEISKLVQDVITVPEVSPWIEPLVVNIPLQLLAYYVAVERGTDVDQPRNLAKSVTVE